MPGHRSPRGRGRVGGPRAGLLAQPAAGRATTPGTRRTSARWSATARAWAASRSPSRYADSSSAGCGVMRGPRATEMAAQRHPRAVQLRFRGADRDAEQRADFFVLVAFHVVQHEDGAGPGRQAVDRHVQIHAGIPAARGLGRRGHAGEGVVAVGEEAVARGAERAEPLDDDVHGQPVQPGGQRRLAAEAARASARRARRCPGPVRRRCRRRPCGGRGQGCEARGM